MGPTLSERNGSETFPTLRDTYTNLVLDKMALFWQHLRIRNNQQRALSHLSSPEYIHIKGGPNADPDNFSLRKMFPSNDGKANLHREYGAKKWSNLAFDLSGSDGGATVEFWMKKAGFTAAKHGRGNIRPVNNVTSGSDGIWSMHDVSR